MRKSFKQQSFDSVLTCVGLYINMQSNDLIDKYREIDLASYDRLPPRLREIVNYSRFNMLCISVEQSVALFGEDQTVAELSFTLCP